MVFGKTTKHRATIVYGGIDAARPKIADLPKRDQIDLALLHMFMMARYLTESEDVQALEALIHSEE